MLGSLANTTLVLLANNPRCHNVQLGRYDLIVRFNHCSNPSLFRGRVNILVLRSHGREQYPWGVNDKGHVLCHTQPDTHILQLFPSKPVPFGTVYYPIAKCKSQKGSCSTGLHMIQEFLAQNASSITAVGFLNHFEDQWNATWHDFRNERRVIQDLVNSRSIRLISC